MLSHKKTIYIVFYFIISILIWVFGIYYSDQLGGDIINYQEDYYNKEIGGLIYSYSRDIFNFLNLNFYTYHFFISILEALILSYWYVKYRISFFYGVLSLIYIMSMGWVGHFRASFTIFSLLFIPFYTGFFTTSLAAHSGNIINIITYLSVKRKIFLIFFALIFVLFINFNQTFYFIFEFLDRDRFFDSYIGLGNNDYFEHRNLWDYENGKLYLSIIIVTISYFFGTNSYKFFLIIPYSTYLLFGFDAYTAQKAFLNFSFIVILGFNSLKKNFFTLICKFLIILDLCNSIMNRWTL